MGQNNQLMQKTDVNDASQMIFFLNRNYHHKSASPHDAGWIPIPYTTQNTFHTGNWTSTTSHNKSSMQHALNPMRPGHVRLDIHSNKQNQVLDLLPYYKHILNAIGVLMKVPYLS